MKKRMDFLSIFVLCASLLSPVLGTASEKSCEPALRPFGQLQSFVKDPTTGKWSLNLSPLNYGLQDEKHGRGFLSAYPDESVEFNDPSFHELKSAHNLLYWAQWVQVVRSLEDATKLLNRFPATFKSGKLNLMMVPLFYIAGSKVDELKNYRIYSDTPKAEAQQSAIMQKRFFREMLQPDLISNQQSSRLFYLSAVQENADGTKKYEFKFLPQSEVRRFDPEHGQFYDPNGSDIVALFRGWTMPPNRGVILFDDFYGNTERVKTIEKLSRRFFREGIIGSITFSTPDGMKAVIEGCRDTNRKGQGPGGSPIMHERFNEQLIRSYIEHLKDGTTYSVEVRDTNGKVIGGGFGDIYDGYFNADSTFYPELLKWQKDEEGKLILVDGKPVPVYEKDQRTGEIKRDAHGNPIQSRFGIEVSKIAKYFLFKKMKDAGYFFQDAEMVSDYTASVGGKYIPVEEFQKLKDQAATLKVKPTNIDWSPIVAGPEVKKNK